MNEKEYIQSRIKYLKEIIDSPDIPQDVKHNQQNALKNYSAELNRLNRKSF